ncbi:ATPase family AAA domain-containing protein 2 [Sigmodon hispidus]
MVVLRSSLELPSRSTTSSATDSLDLSSEFLSLEDTRQGRPGSTRAAEKSRIPTAAAGDGSSVKEVEIYHHTRSLKSFRKKAQISSDSSFDKNMERTEKHANGRHFTRQLARQQADKEKEECKEDKAMPITHSLRNRNIVQNTEHLHEQNGDVEVRRSCRIRSRYSTVNQSVLFDKLITNTAEAVLQKMDDMKKMRRQRMKKLEDLGVFNETEESNLTMYTRGKRKAIQQADEETTDNQDGSVESSEEGEEQEDDDGEDDEDGDDEDGEEDNQKRYYLRQRKAAVYYQAPLEKPRHQRKPNIFYSGPASPARSRYHLSSTGPRSPYCKRMNRRRHAIHSSDSTSSSSSEDDHFERRRKRNRNRAINRCLPLNFRKDEIRGIYKDRMKIGANLADVDPMQLDSSVRFDSVGGLSNHIAALKEMVVFPLLYPEVFEKFKIQPPRGCLFYGPPGTGKTLVARALANECSQGDKRVAFFMRKGADCLSKWVGESERQLRLLFDQAYQMRPAIIFFDEIDGLAPVRSSRQDQIHSSIVSTLLALMDGLDSRGEIVVIGATNRLDSIDPALRRPGRFDREFLFSLPDKDARKEILKIHTRDWNPKPLDMFLEELAENCVGYCGADIKSICAEAALCALRRRYPQIYTTSEKLQLDLSSINISAKDFETAMQKIIPASQRAVTSPGQALSAIVKPLLQNTVHMILEALQKVFPHVEIGTSKPVKSDVSCPLLESDLAYSDDDMPSMYENGLSQKSFNQAKENFNFLHLNRNACYQPMSFRPRLLIVGEPGFGQSSHLAPAVIHALEKFTVYTLDIPVLFGISTTSPEETCSQTIREAKRTAPSIVYVPHIHLWWEIVGPTLKATFMTLLQTIPSFAPVLLLATSDKPYAALPEEVQELFAHDYGEIFNVPLPSQEARTKFFEDLILKQAAKPPLSKKKAVLQALEVLPVAPPPGPRPLTEEEVKRLEEQEEDTFRELRIFLRNVTHRLAIDKRFRVFTKPVDPDEVPDYVTVIKQPMDLSSVISKIDLHKYLTVKDYLKDIDLICSNALEYNPDRDPGDRLIRHRACALRDTAYAIIKEELDEDFEQLCEEIQESRKKRGCSSSKYAPSYYHVMPKQNSTPAGDKRSDQEQNEKKAPCTPVACSTPAQLKRKVRNKSNWHVGNKIKRRKLSQAKDNNQTAMNNQIRSDTEESQHTSTEHTELGNTGESSIEENEKQNASESNIDLKNNSSTSNIENELEESNQTTECTELRKDKSDCNGDSPSSQVIDLPDENESKEMYILRMTRARRSQVEQQQLISVEKALSILSQPTPALIVDHKRLKNLLKTVVKKSRDYNIFQLENLYAVISQCIYEHRRDYDKTALVQKMEQAVENFSCCRS